MIESRHAHERSRLSEQIRRPGTSSEYCDPLAGGFRAASSLIHSMLLDLLSASSTLDPDYAGAMQRVIEEAGRSEQTGFRLSVFPLIMHSLVDGRADDGLLIACAWRALHIAAKLLDDVEDGDLPQITDGAGASVGRYGSRMVNMATGFIALSGLALDRLPPEVGQSIQHEFHRSTLLISGGQHRDLLTGIGDDVDLDVYFSIMSAKTGQFFALAGRACALSSEAGDEVVAGMEQVGHLAGLIIQLLDDLLDWRGGPKGGDLANGRLTLPASYALTVAGQQDKARLQDLLRDAQSNPASLAAVYELVDQMRADLYIQAEIDYHTEQALLLAQRCAPARQSVPLLERWLAALLLGVDRPLRV